MDFLSECIAKLNLSKNSRVAHRFDGEVFGSDASHDFAIKILRVFKNGNQLSGFIIDFEVNETLTGNLLHIFQQLLFVFLDVSFHHSQKAI